MPHTVLRGPREVARQPELDSERAIVRAVRGAGVPEHVPVQVENNVNCAALAEQRDGCARDERTFAMLQIGVGIGIGLVLDGRLFTGANGVAGEASVMPFPWHPGGVPQHEGLERHLGSAGLMQRVAAAWPRDAGPCPATAEALFRLAGATDVDGRRSSTARRMVDDHAVEVGRLAAALVSLVDPGLVVLSGGVGSNPLLLPGVRSVLDTLPWPTRVVPSPLGVSATLTGVTRLAVASAVQDLLARLADPVALPG
ncbi:hypothetical protein GCM10025868_29490 [Angustibacter aerolatus]|uniref:ROK family protein n=1 Tax=Angustibacter aerolatus TaxID=1162965 RepID=A0ABQ6JJY4_9ACTN|nr:ROK family protein [Angustibacter aerolatus]GMA87699.1 hypothetical protein GCM10025868_29490 [Angustibacter aerolatus]